jgi:hypothetical protein
LIRTPFQGDPAALVRATSLGVFRASYPAIKKCKFSCIIE